MSKIKVDKNVKKKIYITLAIGFIANLFIDSGINIALLCIFMYIIHEYLATTKNIEVYSYYEYRDKEKFEKGKRGFACLIYIYIVIRIILLTINPETILIYNEMILIIFIYAPYESYLNKKYVINTNSIDDKQVVFIKNKLCVSIGIIIFVGFTLYTFEKLHNIDSKDYVKYGKYEYNLTSEGNKKKLEIRAKSRYMMGEENDENAIYFNDFLIEGKKLLKDQIFESYVFISMLIMLALAFIEAYPKNKNIITVTSNVFIILFLVSSIFVFNYDTLDRELRLSTYFHNYIS